MGNGTDRKMIVDNDNDFFFFLLTFLLPDLYKIDNRQHDRLIPVTPGSDKSILLQPNDIKEDANTVIMCWRG